MHSSTILLVTPHAWAVDVLLLLLAGVLGLAAFAALLIWRQRKQRQRTTPTSPVDKADTGSNGLAAKLDVEAAGDQGPPPDWSAWSRYVQETA